MSESKQYLIFTLDENRYVLDLNCVERIAHVVEITPLPQAPDIVLGILNVGGQIIPAVNTRRRFGLPEREFELLDQLIIAHTSKRKVALLVDAVLGVIESSSDKIIKADKILPYMDYIEGVVKLEDGIILIHNLDKFLSLEEEKCLNVALKNT